MHAALKAGKCVEAIKQEFKIKVEDEDQLKQEKKGKMKRLVIRRNSS